MKTSQNNRKPRKNEGWEPPRQKQKKSPTPPKKKQIPKKEIRTHFLCASQCSASTEVEDGAVATLDSQAQEVG